MTMSNGDLNVKWPFWPRYSGFYSVETMTQPRRTCSLGSLGSLDPIVNGNVQWTFECQMAMLTALSWVLLTGDYHTAGMHSRGERVHWVHWIQWSMAMSNGHLNVKWPC